MRSWDRSILLLTSLVAVVLLSGAAVADDKTTEANERYWNPLGGYQIQADVAEVEPNNSLATAMALNCGDVLRPATLTPARDTDYVKFTVPAGTIITVGTDADGTTGQIGDTRIRLFANNGAQLAVDDDSGPGLYSLLSFTATYTGDYYVGFAAFGTTTTGAYKGFITCTPPQPPPANDTCNGAIAILCGDIQLSGSTQLAINDYTPLTTGTGGCTGFTAQGRDVAYVLNVAAGDSLAVSYTSSADGSIYIITDCANPTTTCVKGADATLANQAEVLAYMFPSPGLYYLIVDSFGTNTSGTWTLTGKLICPSVPANRTSWGALKSTYR